MILQQRSSIGSANNPSSAIQHNVVLHSNVNEPLLTTSDRLDLNLPSEHNSHSLLSRKANSLMTVYEHTSTNETNLAGSSSHSDTWRARSPSSIDDLTYQRTATPSMPEETTTTTTTTTDQHETVSQRKIIRSLMFSFILI